MRPKRKIMTRVGLQLKMTVFVTAAVLAVSAIVLTLMVSRIRKDYEKLADDRLYDALTAISRIMEQRLLRVEDMTNSSLYESELTSFVTEYKIRKDVDISIFKENGTMVVAPDDYILELTPEDLITRECTIPHIGWKVVLSADRKIIEQAVWKALFSMALLILLMFIVTALAISLTVKYVAEPFVRKQQAVEKEKAVMDSEMALASSAQNELIPHVFPPFPERKEIEISACLHPAREVGGDLYDYFLNDGKLYFCIGDVSGKGVQASLFMAATHYLFRNVAAGMTASEAVNQINRSLSTDNEQCRFVTFWFGCLDLGNGSLEYVNAGHAAPVLIRGGKTEFFLASDNPPLGVLEEMDFIQKNTVLQPSDILLLYTDGVTEAMDSSSNEFGDGRLLEAVRDVSGTGTRDVVDGVLVRVRSHAGGTHQSDDITMLCIKYNGNTNN